MRDHLRFYDRERRLRQLTESPIMSKKTADRITLGIMTEDIFLKIEAELKGRRNVVLTHTESEYLRKVIREEIKKRSDRTLRRK
ncbi:hypothetical protein ACTXT7_007108 [Hymenolepis weldensis]